jgi:hypothetical protein
LLGQWGLSEVADLRKAPNIEALVIDAVKQRTPQAQNLRIEGRQPKFLDGLLYAVAFDLQPDPVTGVVPSYANRVYVTRNNIEAYGHDEFLLQVVGARHSKSFYEVFANGDVVSGIIALVVTITSGWLLILGFYFGKASGRSD